MATLTFYQPAAMSDQRVEYGTVDWANTNSIKISKSSIDYIIYYGSFTYANNNLTGGEIFRIVKDKPYYDSSSYQSIYKEYFIENFSVSALTFNQYLDVGDVRGATQYVLSGSDYISGSKFNDDLHGWDGDDVIYGYAGNDGIFGDMGNDRIDGGIGFDYALYAANKSTITGATKNSIGEVTIRTEFGTDTLINVEGVAFADGTLTIDELIAQYTPPTYKTNDGNVTASIYSGAVNFLQFEMLGSNNPDIVVGAFTNDFINLLGGDDAANGGGGQDVLDGGIGSNFLTGGGGPDTFFLDGRSGTNTWSTITDFAIEDNVNIWGWVKDTSKLIFALDNEGAVGFKGATFHYDLNGNGLIDTSITFSNLALTSIPNPTVEEVANNGYLLFA